MAELGGDDVTGGDLIYEVKVPSPLKKKWAAGRGSAQGGGAPATVGHEYGFGSTLEEYERTVFGCRERGRRCDGPLAHETGKGWVKATKGHYHDARVNKKLRVILFLVEALGGLCGRARRQCYALAERATGAGATDRTRYGKVRGSPSSFYVHHTQQITKAAVMYDAAAIRKAIVSERQKLCMAANAAPGERA